MKKVFAFLFLVFSSSILFAQEAKDAVSSPGKNLVKINLPALALRNVSVQYERAIGRKITIATTVRFMPEGNIPLKSAIIDIADDPEIERQLNNISVSNKAIMPEVRFYLGRKGAFRGFYLGPFVSIAQYKATLPFEYDDAGTTKTIPLSGSVNTFTGGLMIGTHIKLSKLVYLDLWFLGPNYGISKGDVTGQQKLTTDEQQSLRNELNNLDIPLTKFTYDVNNNGATINFDGPWAGVRSGICLGFRF